MSSLRPNHSPIAQKTISFDTSMLRTRTTNRIDSIPGSPATPAVGTFIVSTEALKRSYTGPRTHKQSSLSIAAGEALSTSPKVPRLSAFTALPLNIPEEEATMLKLPYKELHFPRLDRGMNPTAGFENPDDFGPAAGSAAAAAELDNMWMMGFLDYDSQGPGGNSRGVLSKELAEYERMFHVRQVGEVSKAKKPTALDEPNTEQQFKESRRSFLSGVEIARMRELSLKAQEQRGSRLPSVAERLASSAYLRENKVIRRALALRGETGGRKLARLFRPPPRVLTSSAMDNLLWLERIEAQAAVVIQRAWRGYLRKCFWRRFILEAKGAVGLQRLWRGYFTRKIVKRIRKQRDAMATRIQSVYKGRLARRRAMGEHEYQSEAARDIQRVFRGYVGRKYVKERYRKRMVVKIQRLWRGVKGRAIADRLYLDKCVTTIQRNVRMWLDKRWYHRKRIQWNWAATRIQTVFRGWSIRLALQRMMRQKCYKDITSWMALLNAEEVQLDMDIYAILRTRADEDLEGRIGLLHAEWLETQAAISEREYDFMMLQTERVKLTVRAVDEGWSTQLDRELTACRKEVSRLKSHALFTIAKKLRQLEKRAEKLDLRFFDLLQDRKRASDAWTEYHMSIFQKERAWELGAGAYELAKSAAQEKRKWAIQHYTDSGKVDIKLQNARNSALRAALLNQPLDSEQMAEIFPHHQSRQMTIASGNVLELAAPPLPSDPMHAENATRERRIKLYHQMTMRMTEYDTKFGNAWGGSRFGQQGIPELLPQASQARPPAIMDRQDSMGQQVSFHAGSDSYSAPGVTASQVGHVHAADGSTVYGAGSVPYGGSSVGNTGILPSGIAHSGGFPGEPAAINEQTVQGPDGAPQLDIAALAEAAHFDTLGGEDMGGTVASLDLTNIYKSDRELQEETDAEKARIIQQIPKAPGPRRTGEAKTIQFKGADPKEVRPDIREAGGGKEFGFLNDSEGIELGGQTLKTKNADGKFMTTGKYFEGEHGRPLAELATGKHNALASGDETIPGVSALSLEQSVEDTALERLRNTRLGEAGKGNDLRELARKGTVSRFAGIGHTGDVPRNVKHPRDMGTGAIEDAPHDVWQEFDDPHDPRKHPDVIDVMDDGLSGAALDQVNENLGIEFGEGVDEQIPYFGEFDENAGPRGEPDYLVAEAKRMEIASTTALPPESKDTIGKLIKAAQQQSVIDRLPPGLEGARRGAAAATIASSAVKGTIGHTLVQKTKLDRDEIRLKEEKEMNATSARISQLESQVAAVAGQAELVQYGALTKPLMDGMASLMTHLMASDATKVSIDRTKQLREQQKEERARRLAAVKKEVEQAQNEGRDYIPENQEAITVKQIMQKKLDATVVPMTKSSTKKSAASTFVEPLDGESTFDSQTRGSLREDSRNDSMVQSLAETRNQLTKLGLTISTATEFAAQDQHFRSLLRAKRRLRDVQRRKLDEANRKKKTKEKQLYVVDLESSQKGPIQKDTTNLNLSISTSEADLEALDKSVDWETLETKLQSTVSKTPTTPSTVTPSKNISSIPWNLLDELHAEKDRLAFEMSRQVPDVQTKFRHHRYKPHTPHPDYPDGNYPPGTRLDPLTNEPLIPAPRPPSADAPWEPHRPPEKKETKPISLLARRKLATETRRKSILTNPNTPPATKRTNSRSGSRNPRVQTLLNTPTPSSSTAYLKYGAPNRSAPSSRGSTSSRGLNR